MMTRAGLIDTHAHVMARAFDADRDAVFDRAQYAGVVAMLAVGYDLPTSRGAVDLARRIGSIRATVGIHPNYAGQASPEDFEEIAALARSPEVVAIGETGLDNYRQFTPPSRQREALDWHRQLADDLSLPLIIHNREADAGIAEALSAAPTSSMPGLLHCFSSTDPAFLGRMLEAGYFVSFAGPLTFKTAEDLRGMAVRVPLDRLLVETDCPYLAPAPHRGKRNEPAFVRDTARCLASVSGLPFDRLVDQLFANTLRLFPAFDRLQPGVA